MKNHYPIPRSRSYIHKNKLSINDTPFTAEDLVEIESAKSYKSNSAFLNSQIIYSSKIDNENRKATKKDLKQERDKGEVITTQEMKKSRKDKQ